MHVQYNVSSNKRFLILTSASDLVSCFCDIFSCTLCLSPLPFSSVDIQLTVVVYDSSVVLDLDLNIYPGGFGEYIIIDITFEFPQVLNYNGCTIHRFEYNDK